MVNNSITIIKTKKGIDWLNAQERLDKAGV